MAIFAKKTEPEPRVTTEVRPTPPAPTPSTTPAYGIAEATQLMRSLPVDQHPDLVVRVVRATLASLHVHLPDIIEDATRKQKATQERIVAVHGQIAELERQLEIQRKEIAALEADLKETTSVKERLQMAEKSAGVPPPPPSSADSTFASLFGQVPSGSGAGAGGSGKRSIPKPSGDSNKDDSGPVKMDKVDGKSDRSESSKSNGKD
jgi:hypothetical protein